MNLTLPSWWVRLKYLSVSEWSIGTEYSREDVFPKTRVGVNTTKKVALVNGYMQLEGLPSGVSIGDFTKRKVTSDSSPDPTANRFQMEPGRCLKQTIYGVSKAHVLSRVDVMPTCVKRVYSGLRLCAHCVLLV